MQKIALEEHFGPPELPQYYAVGQFGFRKADADDFESSPARSATKRGKVLSGIEYSPGRAKRFCCFLARR
jgi:hypothetical protein